MKDKNGKTLHVGDFVKATFPGHRAPVIGRILRYEANDDGRFFVFVSVPMVPYDTDVSWFHSAKVELDYHPLPEYEETNVGAASA